MDMRIALLIDSMEELSDRVNSIEGGEVAGPNTTSKKDTSSSH